MNVFLYIGRKSYQKLLSILKALHGMLMVICQSFVGVSKTNETSQHWVCAQGVLQQHKQDVQWKHSMNTKSAHVEHNVKGEKN